MSEDSYNFAVLQIELRARFERDPDAVRGGSCRAGARPGRPNENRLPLAKALRFRQGGFPMKPTEGVHKYAAEQVIAEEEALKKGMEAKSKELVEKGAEVYAKA